MNNDFEIEISSDMIFAVEKLLHNVYNPVYTLSNNAKLLRSIGFELVNKFENLKDKLIKKVNLLDTKKKKKVKLKYYELFALHEIIKDLISLSQNGYDHHQLQTVLNLLNKKLQS